MDMKLELVPVPVPDVDRSKAFYTETLGFALDVDVTPSDGVRVVQLTPPGSACSIVISTGLQEISDMTPGTVKGLHLVVDDIAAAREELLARGVASGHDVAERTPVRAVTQGRWRGVPGPSRPPPREPTVG